MKSSSLKYFLFLGLLALGNFVFASSNESEDLENTPKWKSNFSIKINEDEFDFNNWFIQNLDQVSLVKQQSIVKHFKMRAPNPNIARAQLNFVCENEDKIEVIPVDFDVTFLSGKTYLHEIGGQKTFSEHPDGIVISTRSFYGDQISGKDLVSKLKLFFQSHYDIESDNPDHSENSMMIFMKEEQTTFLSKIPDESLVHGIFLQFLSLNDSCNPCLELFNSFVLRAEEILFPKKGLDNSLLSETCQ